MSHVARRVNSSSGSRAPRPRVRPDLPGEGYLFPGEVARLLGCEDVDYHQLRRLFRLVRAQVDAEVRERKWARYSLLDVAALRIALELCGGVEALGPGRRLSIAPVDEACRLLRARGVNNPLLDVPMRRHGRTVLVEIDGMLFNPGNGQLVLRNTSSLIRDFVDRGLAEIEASTGQRARDPDFTKLLLREARRRPRAREAARTEGLIPVE